MAWPKPIADLARWTIPDYYSKTPYNSFNAWTFAAPVLVILLQIHLLLRYDPCSTFLLRASLIPVAVIFALRSAFAHYYTENGNEQLQSEGQHITVGISSFALCMIMWTLHWGLVRQRPKLKVAKTHTNGDGKSTRLQPSSAADIDHQLPVYFPGTWVPLELDLVFGLRAVGWEHGIREGAPALPVPSFTRQQRWQWIYQRLAPTPLSFVLYDAGISLLGDERFNIHRSSIWDARHGSFGFAGPYLVCAAYAVCFICAIGMQHAILGCISVALFNDLPTRWDPPAFKRPLRVSSVRDFWRKGWHQALRFTFLAVGFWPVRALLQGVLGRQLTLVAATWAGFIASGLLHHLGCAALVPDPIFRLSGAFLFFTIQPLAIVGEMLWQRATGRRVRGWWGWLWTMTWLIATSPLLFDTTNGVGMLAAQGASLGLTRRPVTLALDCWDMLVTAYTK